ncbi:PepSY-associated TM helix domain-containing protein [Catenovulum sp. SM1970]|uniref:PepSY-associated TM helix domain-containing protein n=1 Tax=Marinifaba aquimaris TaxID=2741323 RepID=UPI00157490DC|nr:PepSY-associated TM helix domain-containing protein [Marinifaba aquimaris]NTS78644.1 PepSY-associated TM helix domain-containing protein [Marinifaba aquimaris]
MTAAFLKLNRTIHWMSSAFGLATLIFFSITGITLNHPSFFEADSQTQVEEIEMSENWLRDFHQLEEQGQLNHLTIAIDQKWSLPIPRNIEHDEYEWILDFQRPGGYATVILDVETGLLTYEKTSDGFIALINDLHKGRHSGLAWQWLIDITAVICLLFAVTGLIILYKHARQRTSTWPLVIAGTLLPLIIYWTLVP